MGKKELRDRDVWQKKSGLMGKKAEDEFEAVFLAEFTGTEYVIRKEPKELKDIYSKNPKHGVSIDYAITNKKTKKTLYVEIKSQEGYVPGETLPKDGRGNAHERSCKFFTPGLLKVMCKLSNLPVGTLPFWIVYQGRITRDAKRTREITYWFDEYGAHFFLWKSSSSTPLINHFKKNLRHILD
ncbi:MunI restriction endonuclease [Cenarchaeum symbiosum A]|uniref:MunI restriction endonuclease n=1 Tax=Cenarchaeum symbiosum (strain A) TaxID=414004 RepID=A0RV62_CENSY|nr:MunI restriction endonuclease [Cenarchaeum symbiosum A]